MMYLLVLKIIHMGWLAIPGPLYALYNKQYLDCKQKQLLIIQCIMLLGFMLPGWLMQAIRLVCNGLFVLITLDLCIIEYQQFISRYQIQIEQGRRTKKYQQLNGKPIFMINSYHTLKKFKLKQTFVIVLFVVLWTLLRIRFTVALQYGIGMPLYDGTKFDGFLHSLDGWNCNYPQYTYIPVLWLCILMFCYWFVTKILQQSKHDMQIQQSQYIDINKYKIYLIKYLIVPACVVLCIQVIYNTYAHFRSRGMLECYWYFKNGILMHWIIDWGIVATVGLFFYMKSGMFLVQSEHQNSTNSIQDVEQRLDQLLIKRRNN